MNGHPVRLVAAAIVLAAAVTGCVDGGAGPVVASSTASPPTATEPAATTTTELSDPTTVRVSTTDATRTSGGPMDTREALRFVWAFDPVEGDPDDLAIALDVTGVSTALELPVLIEDGSDAVRGVVLEQLAEPSSWSVAILVQMLEYGMPSGSLEAPRPWPEPTQTALEDALAVVAEASYGACAELMIDLNRLYVREEVNRCAAEGCNWGDVWYAVPEALTRPIGLLIDDSRFEGVVTVVSDTGAGDPLAITAELVDRWVITARNAPAAMPDASTPNDCTATHR